MVGEKQSKLIEKNQYEIYKYIEKLQFRSKRRDKKDE